MTLWKIIYQLIGLLGLTDSEEDKTLFNDIEKYELRCSKDDATKFEKMYHKLHQGIYFRMASPFLLVYLKKWADNMLNGSPDKEKDYELR